MTPDLYNELISKHGNDFLRDCYPEYEIHTMDEINKFFDTPLEAVTAAYNGYAYINTTDVFVKAHLKFDPNVKHFTFDSEGRIVSINDNYLSVYLKMCIPHAVFEDWCIEKGYSK